MVSSIWLRRNKTAFDPHKLEFLAVLGKVEKPGGILRKGKRVSWKPPEKGFIVLNNDAATGNLGINTGAGEQFVMIVELGYIGSQRNCLSWMF